MLLLISTMLLGAASFPLDSTQIQQELEVDLPTRVERLRSLEPPRPLSRIISDLFIEFTEEVSPKPEEETVAVKDFVDINEKSGISEYLFEADIHLTDNQIDWLLEDDVMTFRRKRRQANMNSKKLWTDNTIYYSIEDGVGPNGQNAVNEAIRRIESNTCLTFVNNQSATNRIRIFRGSGCYSQIGMVGGEQKLSLGSGCELAGIASHELTHSLGFWHTHMRSDRDDYVTVHVDNIKPTGYGNFGKLGVNKTVNYTPYDFASFMHYGPTAFAFSGKKSITPADNNYLHTMGTRDMSFYDAMMINEHYGCNEHCLPDIFDLCKNGGYPNPNNCSFCNCPLGYGGTQCDEKPDECGEELNATSEWQSINLTIGSNSKEGRQDINRCTYWIRAAENSTIELQLVRLEKAKCAYGCPTNSIEIKHLEDKRVVNPRICCPSHLNQSIISQLNPTPILISNKEKPMIVEILYRQI